MTNNLITKDISTKKLYLKRVSNFIKRAYREAAKENHPIVHKDLFLHSFGQEEIEGLSLLNTVIWGCRNWSVIVSQDSWRSYRAAFNFIAEIYYETNFIDDKTYERIKSVLKKTNGMSKKDLEIKTSRRKQKHFSIKDLKKVDDELKLSKSIWSVSTRVWLRAGILTGLRPVEWRKSILIEDDENIVLKVANAKNTNNRANGDFRHLYLNHLEENEINIIKNHLKICNNFSNSKETWDNYYNGCSNLLRQKTRSVFPNREKFPTLYSTRHQFSANSKASGCRPEELASLMGHATDLTAQMTYGKKIHGTRGRKPKINDLELSTVRKHKKTLKYQEFSFTQKSKNKVKSTKNKNK